jgi:hypothetical protein
VRVFSRLRHRHSTTITITSLTGLDQAGFPGPVHTPLLHPLPYGLAAYSEVGYVRVAPLRAQKVCPNAHPFAERYP